MHKKRTPWEIQRAVIAALILRELKTRFGAHRLGAVWLVLEPAAHIALLLMIFGYLRHIGPPDISTSVFLLTGIVPFLLCKNVALRVMDAVDSNRGLFGYRVIKPMDTFLSRFLLEIVLYSAVFIVLVGILLWLGVQVSLHRPLLFLGSVGLVSILGFGMGALFAVLGEVVPEAKLFMRLIFLPLYFICGIIFPITLVPHEYLDWLLWNPVLHAVELSREAFFLGYQSVPGISAIFLGKVVLVTLFAGLWAYRLRRRQLVAL